MGNKFFNMGLVVFVLLLSIGACSDDDDNGGSSGAKSPVNKLKFSASNAQETKDTAILFYAVLSEGTNGKPDFIANGTCVTKTGGSSIHAGTIQFTLKDCPDSFFVSQNNRISGRFSYSYNKIIFNDDRYELTGSLTLLSTSISPVDIIEITDIRIDVSDDYNRAFNIITTTVAFGVSSSVLGGGFTVTTPMSIVTDLAKSRTPDSGELLIQGAENTKIKITINAGTLSYSLDDGSGIFKLITLI